MGVGAMLRLIDLEPQFIRYTVERVKTWPHRVTTETGEVEWNESPVDVFIPVHSICEADGISFLCPKCRRFGKTHRIQIFFAGRNIPESIGLDPYGKPARWKLRGNDYFDFTLGSTIIITKGCCWHGLVEHGFVKSV